MLLLMVISILTFSFYFQDALFKMLPLTDTRGIVFDSFPNLSNIWQIIKTISKGIYSKFSRSSTRKNKAALKILDPVHVSFFEVNNFKLVNNLWASTLWISTTICESINGISLIWKAPVLLSSDRRMLGTQTWEYVFTQNNEIITKRNNNKIAVICSKEGQVFSTKLQLNYAMK